MLVSGYAAVLGSNALDWPSALFGGLALLARGLMIAGVLRLDIPSRWVNAATLLYIPFYALDLLLLSRTFLNATIHLVFFVAIVKLLTASSQRDFFFLEVIAFLELLAASILSTSANFFVCLVFFLFFSISTFASSEIRRAASGRKVVARSTAKLERRLGWLAASAGIGILAITAGLFFVLPRTARAALERFTNISHRVAGYSNEVTLGQTGDIRQHGGAVMHIKFGSESAPRGLKWRGNALAEFDGWKWFNSPHPTRTLRPEMGLLTLVDDDQRRRHGQRYSYEVWLHTPPSDALFIAGLPEIIRVPASRVMETKTGAYQLPIANPDQFRYIVHSYVGGAATVDGMGLARLEENDRHYYLRLPPVDPRVLALAQRVTAGYTSDLAKARAIERFLRTQFAYSLEPLTQQPDDPLVHFLLERRKGHCEYFASAMAVMLRAVWVPSRVATGFQSGEFNPLSGWQVVRARDAHAWVEAFIPGQGWTTFDPTPSDPNQQAGSPWSRAGLWLDAMDMFWQEWVLGYDIDQQMKLAFEVDKSRRRLSFAGLERWARSAMGWLKAAGTQAHGVAPQLAAGVAGVAGSAIACWWLFGWLRERKRMIRLRRGQMLAGDASRLYARMLRLLHRRGYTRAPGQTPREFARSVTNSPVAREVEEFTNAYHEARYGNRPGAAARMAELLDTIEHLPRVAR